MKFHGYYRESSEFNSPRESNDDDYVHIQNQASFKPAQTVLIKTNTKLRRSKSLGNGSWSNIVGIKSPKTESSDTWSSTLSSHRRESPWKFSEDNPPSYV